MKEPRIFPHWPGDHTQCPICGGHEDKPCMLVPIIGTKEDNRIEALPVHVNCILSQVVALNSERATVLFALPLSIIT